MAHPQTEVANIQLQPTTYLSTPKGRKAESAWTWETKNTCQWPIPLVISVPKIFVNGQFYLSSQKCGHMFLETQCIYSTQGIENHVLPSFPILVRPLETVNLDTVSIA